MLDIPLGPFRLNRLIGVGGAGEVWQGLHVRQAVPVAVKVITAARARDPKYREAFQNEVRAVAGLDHPGVVVVFDTGVVDEQAERASLGRMVAGSPFLAMELATVGSLRTHPTPGRWAELRDQLQWLLDVLAHAHAHGVIHRDLKPGNVLVFDEPALEDDASGASRLRLTDFGLAHATDRAERAIKGTSGTPIFMAPEQFRGQWRDFGPWTDLYALGCMAFALATGKPPFRGRGVSHLMQAHLSSPPPPLPVRFPVPEGFEGWVHRLMHKDPEHRFQRAADAAWALMRLGDPVEVLAQGESPDRAPMRDHQPTVAMQTLTRSWPDWERAMEAEAKRQGEVAAEAALRDAPALCERRVPPLPRTWRMRHVGQPSMRLVGAGLGLYGLREIPLVGREAERDVIWDALHAVRQTGEVRCCVLRGTAGSGKTRLAEWISQRADEVGNAVVVRATHSPGGGPADGLARMVAAALGCVGMSRLDMQKRIERFLRLRGVDDEYEWHALVELIWPLPDEHEGRSGQRTVRFGSANERYALIHRLLGYLAGHQDEAGVHRPVVLWLDDVQWGSDALGLARYLLGRVGEGERPVLVLMTAQEEALEDRPVEREALERLFGGPHVVQLELQSLDREQRRELVQKLLFLEGELATQVEERTGGNPLFAVQLVGDWVQRGVLEVGATGFVLKRGEQAIIPDDIHVLWEDRIARVLEGHDESARSVLELAALMGADVDDAEWRGACRVAGLEAPGELVADLLARRLARLRPGGWSFAHGMMRESLERSAHESGRAPPLHLAAATTLQIRYDVARQPGIAERLGRHLFYGGKPHEALEPLGVGARERRAMSDYASAMRLLDLREEVLTKLDVPRESPAWGEGWVQRAEILIGQGQLEEAMRFGLRVVETGGAHGWDSLLAPAYRIAAMAAVKLGRTRMAEAWLLKGEEAARAVGDELEIARCLLALGDALRLQGKHQEAMHHCRRALARFAVHEDVRGQADAMAAIASVCRTMGDLEKTEAYAREAIPLYEAVGGRFGVGNAKNTLGEVLRARGVLDEAEAMYREAESLLRALGSPEHYIPMLNLGLLLVDRGRYAEARSRLRLVLAAMERSGRKGLEGALHAALLPCAAHAEDWEAWDEHLARATALLAQTRFVDGDIARAAEAGARLALQAHERARAAGAVALARNQWQALGNVEQAAILAALEPVAPPGEGEV